MLGDASARTISAIIARPGPIRLAPDVNRDAQQHTSSRSSGSHQPLVRHHFLRYNNRQSTPILLRRITYCLSRSSVYNTRRFTPRTANRTGPKVFDLPRELRDNIYFYTWLCVPDLVVPYLGRKSLVRYNSRTIGTDVDRNWTRMETLPAWLFLSQAFFEECMATLNEQMEWI